MNRSGAAIYSATMSLVLIGYRGSGKTTVGKLVAQRTNRPFVDCDQWIVRKAGQGIADIFAQHGEKAFRDLEAEAVAEIAALQNHVIALGGGAMGRSENQNAIRDANHQVVYLRCEPGVLLSRIQSDPATAASRPALTALGGGIEEIQQVLARREPIWQSVMTAKLDVTTLSPQQAADAIVKMMKEV
jgi:shikimate kinase